MVLDRGGFVARWEVVGSGGMSYSLGLTRGMEKARASLLRGVKTAQAFPGISQESPRPQDRDSVCQGLPCLLGRGQAPGVRAVAQPSAVFLRAARVLVSMSSV